MHPEAVVVDGDEPELVLVIGVKNVWNKLCGVSLVACISSVVGCNSSGCWECCGFVAQKHSS